MTAKQTTSHLARILAVILVLAPAVLLAVLLWRDSVNVPFWDEWDDDIAGLFVKFKTGQLAFADFWSQHNESRLVLPRIFILLLGCLTHGNVCGEMAFTFLLACLIAWAIHRLERTAFGIQPKLTLPIFFVSSLLIFSPAQSEAWLWGMEFILYVPLACVLLGLLSCQSKISGAAKWFTCLLMALISTYTFSNGLVVWIVLFPALFFSVDDLSRRGKKRAMLWWMICFAGNSVLYFYNYQFPAANGFWQKIFTDPLPIARYFFAFEGGLLVNRDAGCASCFSSAPVVFMFFAGVKIRRWSKPRCLGSPSAAIPFSARVWPRPAGRCRPDLSRRCLRDTEFSAPASSWRSFT
jgi:hypothetical protein